MAEDRSWIQIGRSSAHYKDGVKEFMQKARLHVNEKGETRCPCLNCSNVYWFTPSVVECHLFRGFDKTYTTWFYHGERSTTANVEMCTGDGMISALQDVSQPWNPSDDVSYDGEINEPRFSAADERFESLFRDVKQELYPGCKTFSVLEFLTKLVHMKVVNQWTNKSFDMMLELLKKAYPETRIPDSYYGVRKKLRELGLGYESIHVCKYDCSLFWKENEKLSSCPVCNTPRYQDNGGKGKKNVPHKVLRYFPIAPRLKRLFASRHTSEHMQWHHLKRPLVDGEPRHPADGLAWKHLDEQYPIFAREPRNVRFGLASDGFNPFGNMSTGYSIWPVILVPYNLPPWMCMKETSFMLTLLIPGHKSPGKDMDVFLRPLVDELKELWIDGVETIDVMDGKRFTLRAAVLWTINDFPAYGNLSGWSTKGYMACPVCNEDTYSERIRGKTCYMGHRCFLPPDHKYRKMTQFNGKREYRNAPTILSGDEILRTLENLKSQKPGKHPENPDRNRKRPREELNWTKKSIFFELEYWSKLLLRHNLDLMHIEKNILDSILGTLLDIEGKTKDKLDARRDLADMNIRKELHLRIEGSKVVKPHASYTLTKKEKKHLCTWLKSVRFPDGYAGRISKNVNDVDGKIHGLKTHDCHILLQRLLPVGIRPFLRKNECATLIELSQFFQKLSSRTLLLSDLEAMQKDIVIILCKLERIFPPAFFDVMIHLAIHLPYEAMLGGPFQFRWMYPFERALKTYKKYVRNKARPEGCIAKAYIANEAATFCSMYLHDTEAKSNHPERNIDIGNQNTVERDLLIFKEFCRPLGKEKIEVATNAQLRKAYWYVLNNCSEVQPYLEKHRKELEQSGATNIDKLQEEIFFEWFKNHMINLRHNGSPEASDELYALANRPDPRFQVYPGCVVNGVKFLIKERDDNRKTQNSGICVKSSHAGREMDFYGVLSKIYVMSFIKDYKVTLFECKWFDMSRRKEVEVEYNILSLNTSFEWYKSDPFILASQAQQVYYLEDIKGRAGWKSVYKVNHRHVWDVPVRQENVEIHEENRNQEGVSSDVQFVCEQPDMEAQSLHRENVDPDSFPSISLIMILVEVIMMMMMMMMKR